MNVLKVTSLEEMEHVIVCTLDKRWSDSDISAHFRAQGDRAGCWWEGLDPEHLLSTSQGLMGVGEALLPWVVSGNADRAGFLSASKGPEALGR